MMMNNAGNISIIDEKFFRDSSAADNAKTEECTSLLNMVILVISTISTCASYPRNVKISPPPNWFAKFFWNDFFVSGLLNFGAPTRFYPYDTKTLLGFLQGDLRDLNRKYPDITAVCLKEKCERMLQPTKNGVLDHLPKNESAQRRICLLLTRTVLVAIDEATGELLSKGKELDGPARVVLVLDSFMNFSSNVPFARPLLSSLVNSLNMLKDGMKERKDSEIYEGTDHNKGYFINNRCGEVIFPALKHLPSGKK